MGGFSRTLGSFAGRRERARSSGPRRMRAEKPLKGRQRRASLGSMSNEPLNRRGFLQGSISLAAPLVLAANRPPLLGAETPAAPARRLKVVCVGGHPDDPES